MKRINKARRGGAYLNLGQVLGTYTVSVNGRKLPPVDLMDGTSIDISGYLRPGRNAVQVNVATLLGNAAFGSRQPYGLVGPVRLEPFGSAALQGPR